jgi:hypothetical protein
MFFGAGAKWNDDNGRFRKPTLCLGPAQVAEIDAGCLSHRGYC